MTTRPRRPSDESVISLSFNPNQKSAASGAPGSEEVPHISGYLLKKSSSGEWQRRYFETNGSFLTYYKSQKMTKLLAALSLPQVGKIAINGEIEDSQGKGVIIQLELKDREYTLRALTVKEAQKWVKVLIQLRDGQASNPGGLTSVKSGIDTGDNSSVGSSGSARKAKSPSKKSATTAAEIAASKEMGSGKTNACCGFF